ncbi:MAG: homoserine O-acetyltransferase MetX [Planctomycetota bacterium]
MSTGGEAAGPESPDSVGWTTARSVPLAGAQHPFPLEAGGQLEQVVVEYETYGEPNADASNAILVCHALSGDAHAAGWDRDAEATGRSWRLRKPGWWDAMIGPGKPIDTRRWFVICANVLGSCYGTTGPSSIDPATGRPYGLSFPAVMVEDWVRLQARLLDHLGIERLHAVVGGSLGGQQALEWTLAHPERVDRALVLAAAPRLSTQGLAFNAVGRYSILHDEGFRDGAYYDGEGPDCGLAAARMLAHITYLSEEGMHRKFGRRLQDKDAPEFGFGVEFAVESYLQYQGRSFTERFDANSYLYITRAMDYYDAARRWGNGDLRAACERIDSAVMAVSFSTDWLYTPAQIKQFVGAMCACGKTVTYADVASPYGHDAFLVETEAVGQLLRAYLESRRAGS